MKKTIMIPLIAGVLSLLIGIFAGSAYQKTKLQTDRQNVMGQFGSNIGPRNGVATGNTTARDNLMKNNAPVSGKVISMDSTSITVQTQDGSNKIVLISDQTIVNKTIAASKTDISVGTEIMVVGNTTNGAVSAQSISIGTSMSAPVSPSPSAATK